MSTRDRRTHSDKPTERNLVEMCLIFIHTPENPVKYYDPMNTI